ncbi:peptidoglycan DD-metalloendopeptidase family protein [Streptomyces longwoodensis]|uniref:peptidoglycan DD-metalloendopeptidase family protein n=1 Tax=Streptomyces longwoodensis TaxID=68231 RepID=UPI0036EA774B
METIRATDAQGAWYGVGTGYGHQEIRYGYTGYGTQVHTDQAGVPYDDDPLFGALPVAFDTTSYSDSATYDGAGGYPTVAAVDTNPACRLPNRADDYGSITPWATEPGSYGTVPPLHEAAIHWTEAAASPGAEYVTPDAFAEAPTQTWVTNPYPYAAVVPSLDVPAHPDALQPPAEQPSSQETSTPLSGTEPEPTTVFEAGPGRSPSPPKAPVAAVPAPRRSESRNHRAAARRSALLTVAAPSVAVIGLAGFAAAAVGLGDQAEKSAQAADDTSPTVEPSAANRELDTQLTGLASGADDFAERASRTQQRIDLRKKRLEQEQRRREEAARREALRPKYALPVTQHGVGELFGAVGSMWAKRHTGLDFPVPMYTPVMAVTDGTVEAKWNQFYGNMVIVTAPDGTETWYCHLAGARFRSGHVQAGEVIAYAGSSGNSSGPHLHLEVHPGGGAAVDPLAWLRSHGLDPT